MSEEYEYIRAIVDCGELLIRSKLKGNSVESRMVHDEDVSEWSDRDVRNCVCGLLDLSDDEAKLIEIKTV